MESVQEIIESMRRVAPPGQTSLSREETARLRGLTSALAEVRPEATAEYARFLAIGERSLSLPRELLRERLAGKSVMVTGGNGCIGSALLYQLRGLGVASLSSVSRNMTAGWPIDNAVAYYHADVRDRRWLQSYVRVARPDVIFHCAAQRSPALAEAEVHRTVTTNLLGTRNVLEVAREERVPQVVLASTGKALRPYSPEIYTASKRAAEWIASSEAARGGMLVSGARFTHVLDNSIVHARLLDAAGWRGDGLMRLHSPDIAFYVQSAIESAQLMLAAFLGAEPGEFRLHAIRDLGWPVSLLDVALGVRGRRATPVYLSGYDPGYEEVPFPGLYDPRTAGDVSPLMNAWEAAALTTSPAGGAGVDSFRLRMGSGHDERDLLAIVEDICDNTQNAAVVRSALDMLSWALLEAALDEADPVAVTRSAQLAAAHEEVMSPAHRKVTEALRRRAQGSALVQ